MGQHMAEPNLKRIAKTIHIELKYFKPLLIKNILARKLLYQATPNLT